MESYFIIITICVVLILSFLFNVLAKRTSLPSVLMLLCVGILLKYGFEYLGISLNNGNILEVLGIVGLIMIVLEAALDLPLSKEKWPLIRKSFYVALFGLIGNVVIFTMIFMYMIQNLDIVTAMIYATPLSILSSAIVIPSVSTVRKDKQEFMVYESTFSDILGIMFFYILLGNVESQSVTEVMLDVLSNLSLTVISSILASLLLLYVFQKLIHFETRFALFLAILILLYAVGKILHLSSLIIILIFGMILRNHKIFIRGKMRRWFDGDSIDALFDNFMLITEETSFVIRTFFFVLFGMSISLGSIVDPQVILTTSLFLIATYIIRFVLMKGIVKKDVLPESLIAPRGLISILLFFAIPEEFHVPEIESGVLFLMIFATSVIMGIELIRYRSLGDSTSKDLDSIE